MVKLPRLTSNEVLRKIQKVKYIKEIRQVWSHKRFKNIISWEKFTLPVHWTNYIHPKILKDIILKLHIDLDEFNNL